MGKPHYVIAIETDGIVKITTPELADWCRRATWTDRMEPIPLTAEILEKNGFEKKAERFRHIEYELVLNPNTEDEHYLIVRLHPANENCDLMWAYIYYSPTLRIDLNTIETKIVNCSVHQLQHALRLCGIEKEIEL